MGNQPLEVCVFCFQLARLLRHRRVEAAVILEADKDEKEEAEAGFGILGGRGVLCLSSCSPVLPVPIIGKGKPSCIEQRSCAFCYPVLPVPIIGQGKL